VWISPPEPWKPSRSAHVRRPVSLFRLIGWGLPLLAVAAIVASFVSLRIWTSRVQALADDLQAHGAPAGRIGSLPVRPSKILLEPGGGFALVFEPPLFAWHTRVFPRLLGIAGIMGSRNDVVVELRGGKVHTTWWGID
jgi:hypothetical protein